MNSVDIVKPALDALKSVTGMVVVVGGAAVLFLLVSGLGLYKVFQGRSKDQSVTKTEEKK